MLKKIAIALTILLIIQIAFYIPSVLAKEAGSSVISAGKSTTVNAEIEDAEELIIAMEIETKVNEEALEKKYPSAKVINNPENGNAIINFSNTEQSCYRLDIFDVNNGLVASYVNLNSDQVVISKEIFNAGAYIYKLEGDSKTLCGTFMLR